MASRTKETPRRRETRRRLVEAAVVVVAERGFHGATVDQIAQRAGFSVGALYSNFGGKDDLFAAVIDEHVEWFLDRLREFEAAEDSAAAAAELLDATARDPGQFLVFIEFWAYAARTPKLRRSLAKRLARIREATAQALRNRSAKSSSAPAMSEDLTVILALALARGIALEKLIDADAVASEDVGAAIAGLIP
jgi:AcrR family transcriptional regulator